MAPSDFGAIAGQVGGAIVDALFDKGLSALSGRASVMRSEVAASAASGPVGFKRWARGDAIDKPLPDGSAPTWDVVRSRYWKNRSEAATQGEFSVDNLRRMSRGAAPLDYNTRAGQWESRELHHFDPQRNGGSHAPINLREVTPDQHRALDPHRK